MNEKQQYTLLEAHQEFAQQTNHRVWDLIDQTSLTAGEEDELILDANASLYHWKQVGGSIQSQRGYWLLSRVYVLLGKVQDALDQALKCHSITVSYSEEMADFNLAFAQEALARAYALAGEIQLAREHLNAAEELGQAVQD